MPACLSRGWVSQEKAAATAGVGAATYRASNASDASPSASCGRHAVATMSSTMPPSPMRSDLIGWTLSRPTLAARRLTRGGGGDDQFGVAMHGDTKRLPRQAPATVLVPTSSHMPASATVSRLPTIPKKPRWSVVPSLKVATV